MADVNWGLLGDAVRHWTSVGFVYREVPWLVPDRYNMVTCPEAEFLVNSKLGSHIGSAEQGFIYLDHTGQLPEGRWVACTPCFRAEPVLDRFHQNGFMKVELYQNGAFATPEVLGQTVSECCLWFLSRLPRELANCVETVRTPDGYDITLEGIEIGSYGLRHFEEVSWVYATGLAEPRFSTALDYAAEVSRGT